MFLQVFPDLIAGIMIIGLLFLYLVVMHILGALYAHQRLLMRECERTAPTLLIEQGMGTVGSAVPADRSNKANGAQLHELDLSVTMEPNQGPPTEHHHHQGPGR